MRHSFSLYTPVMALTSLLVLSGCGSTAALNSSASPTADRSTPPAPPATPASPAPPASPDATAAPAAPGSPAIGPVAPATSPAPRSVQLPHYDPHAPGGACLLTDAEAAQIMAAPVSTKKPTAAGSAVACVYLSGSNAATAGTPFLSVEVRTSPETQAAFNHRQADAAGTPITGLGDAAFFIHLVGATSRDLAVHVGSTSLLLELQRPGQNETTLLAGLEKAASTLIPRIPNP